MKRLLVLLFLLPTLSYAQGAGTPPYRGVNNWPLIFGTDNTYDIGAAGSQRPRTGYFGTSVVTPALTVSGLTATRCVFAGSGGLLSDDSDCTFTGGNLLTVTNGSFGGLTWSGGTSGRLPFLTTGGAFTDDADMTFANGDTLNVARGMFGAGTAALPAIGWQADNDAGGTGFFRSGANFMTMSLDGTARTMWLANGYQLRSDGSIEWCSTTSLACNPDTTLRRAGANVVKVSNGTAANTFALLGGGANVASATALAAPVAGVYHVTGTTTITSITSTNIGSGTCITLIFDGALTFTDGSNLKLAGDFVTTADDTIGVCYDGTNWYETHRSVN